MKKNLFLLLLIFRIISAFACDLPDHFEFEVSNGDKMLYSGCYDAIHKGPHIIEYILTKERVIGESVKRPSVQFTQSRDGGVLQNLLKEHGYSLPHHNDYTRSGYDRGHMAPNADFNDTTENAVMTFFIANIWPQTPSINAGEWLKAENETRRLAIKYLIVKVVIIVDEFSEKKVKDIQVPLNFKRRVYDLNFDEPVYDVVVYQ
ncbi:MAG: DNA/RNA non-specific endonuclease [Treponema sp.]|jgi:DNA/RNA endonuclease G (NUC1)|nr:DNA/RNA non-specific endonuclease [Treponema sp.]